MTTAMKELRAQGQTARAASRQLAKPSTDVKNRALLAVAGRL